jgi:hypothetical protein
MKIRLAMIAALSAVAMVLSGSAQASHLRLRYCQRFTNSSAYTAATPNVSCATAKAVVHRITDRSCWPNQQCDVGRFACVSYYSEFGLSKPFLDSHHGICVASHARRIEFDLG